MAPLDVCPTEDVVQLFLEHLVDPSLPSKSSVRDNPTLSQQQSVARQVHSVVLLYNYYHRKQHPELTYLPFDDFCKLIVVLRAPLLAYMQFMQKLEEGKLVDVEKQLSLTEKMIMDACDICKCLDVSKDVPNIVGWPITKVAILLVDSKKEYCVLRFGSISNGVWSLVETSLDISSQSSEVTLGTKNSFKKSRVIKKATKEELKVEEAGFLQVGYSAVKEVTGINNADIRLLESDIVYSQSKEKTACRFYIMQCTKLIKPEIFQVPLEDVIKSMQGPLAQKSSNRWTTTPVIDYFHVLPYSKIISKWISSSPSLSSSVHRHAAAARPPPPSRPHCIGSIPLHGHDLLPVTASAKTILLLSFLSTLFACTVMVTVHHEFIAHGFALPWLDDLQKTPSSSVIWKEAFSNTLQGSRAMLINMMVDSPNVTDSNVNKDTFTDLDNGPSSGNIKSSRRKGNTESRTLALSVKEPNEIDMNESSIFASQNKEKSQCVISSVHVGEGHEKNKLSLQYNSNGSASVKALKVDSTRMFITEGGVNNLALAPCRSICANRPNCSSEKNTIHDCTRTANCSNLDLEKVQFLLDSKKLLSQTALAALIQKRNKLALQQREIEDEIAVCDKKIERLFTGGADDFVMQIESIVEGCNDIWLKSQGRTSGQQSLSLKRKNLSDAVFMTKSPCQELDDICHENNWVLPTYHLSQSNDGIQAKLSVKGVEFQCSCEGDLCSSPLEARESAAAQMLTMLRTMAKSAE
ncbi:hypothetical protein RJT34_30150 [Clitoria ternatea]|uniref:Uncharacterized protein n=1 Tax=Clitoria ternatea TaxID=43366 RepID=A0AAN9EU30_CLITE